MRPWLPTIVFSALSLACGGADGPPAGPAPQGDSGADGDDTADGSDDGTDSTDGADPGPDEPMELGGFTLTGVVRDFPADVVVRDVCVAWADPAPVARGDAPVVSTPVPVDGEGRFQSTECLPKLTLTPELCSGLLQFDG